MAPWKKMLTECSNDGTTDRVDDSQLHMEIHLPQTVTEQSHGQGSGGEFMS